MSRIHIRYGERVDKNREITNLDMPKNYSASFCYICLVLNIS